jgi:hypothetical protein
MRSVRFRWFPFVPLLALALVGGDIGTGAGAAWSADATPAAGDPGDTVTDVPDDVGLGERLALVQWLKDHNDPPKDAEDLPAMRREYVRLAHPERVVAAPVVPVAVAPAAPVDQRRATLLAQLKKVGISPDPTLSDDQLQKMLDNETEVAAADELRAKQAAAAAAAAAAAQAKAAADASAAAAAQREEDLARLKAEAAAPKPHYLPAPDAPPVSHAAPPPAQPQAPAAPEPPAAAPVDQRNDPAYQAGQAVGSLLVFGFIILVIVAVARRVNR